MRTGALLLALAVATTASACSAAQPTSAPSAATPSIDDHAMQSDLATLPVPSPSPSAAVAATGDDAQAVPAAPTVAVAYEVLSDDRIPGVRRAVHVRLAARVSADELASIAQEVRATDVTDYERTFVTFYLPGMEVGAGAWATAAFDPELEVSILGITADEAALLAPAETTQDDREIVGRWFDDQAGSNRMITIYRSGGATYAEYVYPSGGSRIVDLIETSTADGLRFEEPDASYGDHFLLNADGDLEVRDSAGLIAVAAKTP